MTDEYSVSLIERSNYANRLILKTLISNGHICNLYCILQKNVLTKNRQSLIVFVNRFKNDKNIILSHF